MKGKYPRWQLMAVSRSCLCRWARRMASMMQPSSRCTKCSKTCSQAHRWSWGCRSYPSSDHGIWLAEFLVMRLRSPWCFLASWFIFNLYILQSTFLLLFIDSHAHLGQRDHAIHIFPWLISFRHPVLPELGRLGGGKGALADSFGGLDEHRQLAEKPLGGGRSLWVDRCESKATVAVKQLPRWS